MRNYIYNTFVSAQGQVRKIETIVIFGEAIQCREYLKKKIKKKEIQVLEA